MPERLYFTDEGQGFPVLLIHGFCETHAIWNEFKDDLTESFRVITIDLPGFGKSPLPDKPFSIQYIARQVLQLIEKLSLDLSVVIGHSLGGYVTLEMISAAPKRFAGFGLFHSTAFADDDEKKTSRNKTIEFVKQHGTKVFAEAFIPELFYKQNREQLNDTIQQVVKLASSTDVETIISYTKAMRDRQDRTDVLEKFEEPILFIAGVKDTVMPVEKVDEQILLPKRAIVNIIQNVGHMGMFEDREKTQAIVKDFIKLCAPN
ncbi:MAG: alpha/beta hydrolase [Fulvivirga sp.]|nr:alpha/beta hydrolase [Fulvivirga sp.]